MKKTKQAKAASEPKKSNRKLLLISIFAGIIMTAVSWIAGGIIIPQSGNAALSVMAQISRNFLVYSAFIFGILYFIRSRKNRKNA